MGKLRTNVIGFDDGPFARDHRGDIPLVGIVCSRTRVDGVLVGKVRRDGANATRSMIGMSIPRAKEARNAEKYDHDGSE